VGDLSQAVGVSQPVVTRSLSGLEGDGLVRSETSVEDKRVRRVALSRKGKKLVQFARREAWIVIEAAVAQTCADARGDLLSRLNALEHALAEKSLLQRVQER
jgi:DNA-binding MarR family transcriptional regulator